MAKLLLGSASAHSEEHQLCVLINQPRVDIPVLPVRCISRHLLSMQLILHSLIPS